MEPFVVVDKERCIGCRACQRDCPQDEFRMLDGKANAVSQHCIKCGHCVAVCPADAISVTQGQQEVTEITTPAQLNPSLLHSLLRQRRTIRQFSAEPVPDAVISMILDAGRISHTGRNRQGLSFSVLRGKPQREAQVTALLLFRRIKAVGSLLSSYLRRKNLPDDFFFFGAPLVIVVCGGSETDAVFAAANMEYMAEANGLGVLVSGFFTMAVKYSRRLKRQLQIPRGSRALATLVIGYPNIRYLRTVPREPLDVKYL